MTNPHRGHNGVFAEVEGYGLLPVVSLALWDDDHVQLTAQSGAGSAEYGSPPGELGMYGVMNYGSALQYWKLVNDSGTITVYWSEDGETYTLKRTFTGITVPESVALKFTSEVADGPRAVVAVSNVSVGE
jgi:hypothetical protein